MSPRISNILLIIFLVLMIPSIAVYAYNANHEYHESEESKANGLIEKSAEQRAEFILFGSIAIIYAIPTVFITVYRNKTLPYYIILVTTVVITVIYYLSKTTGVWIPDGFDNWIVDTTSNWKDAVTKISQQAFVIPLSMLLMYVKIRK
jgi:MFS superfamily sulfate permease-like transporter